MSTPREEAHQAALEGPAWNIIEALGVGADAASDVWEPREERLKAALRAAGVSANLVEEIANG